MGNKPKGIPGRDYSGVDPDTGKYKIVRGNHVGEKAERAKRGQPSSKTQRRYDSDKHVSYWVDEDGNRHEGINPNAPKTPEDRKRKNMKICGAKRSGRSQSGPGICCQPAGWGTDHQGYGTCRHHGGLLPSHTKKAQREIAQDMVKTYGLPKDIDPQTALIEEVQRTAGHVDYLNNLIQEIEDDKGLTQRTETGVMPSVWIEMYQRERTHLVQVSAAAIRAGIAERQVRIAEEQGKLFAMVIKAIISDENLGLTNAQLAAAPKVVRKHLSALPLELEEGKKEPDIIDAIVIEDHVDEKAKVY